MLSSEFEVSNKPGISVNSLKDWVASIINLVLYWSSVILG